MSMAMENKLLSALTVADSPGHILERLCVSWANYGIGVHHAVQASRGVSNYELCQMAKQHDVIHWVDQLRFIHCASAISVPQVVMVHHLTPDMEQEFLTKVKYCDAVTTVSAYWRDYLINLVDAPVSLLPQTIDTSWFVPQTNDVSYQLRQKAGIRDEEFVVGFVGKAKADHMGRKGLDLFLEVLQAASELWLNLVVVLVGPGWEGLKTTIESLGIRVLHYEFNKSEDTRSAYWLMDVLLVTARVEGGPVTVLEAMGCGVPVISSPVGHIPEILFDGETGFVCQQRLVKEYIDSLACLREDDSLRIHVANAARAFIVREREDTVVIPKMDFPALYLEAIQGYQTRMTHAQKMSSYVAQGQLLARYSYRRLMERIR
jgi:glycosyltransferase involved in cell wall biosynthesis